MNKNVQRQNKKVYRQMKKTHPCGCVFICCFFGLFFYFLVYPLPYSTASV